jgi:RES domain-containing protein
MALDAFIRPWSGVAWRHIPAGSAYDVLDFRLAGRGADNRWNVVGERTLYLASDAGVALGELARHLDVHHPPGSRLDPVARQLYSMQVDVTALLDLREPRVCEELSLQDAPRCFLDMALAQSVAQYLRRVTPAQGILAPSMAFLDRTDRWVLILFLEKLPSDPHAFLTNVQAGGVFLLES